MIITNDNLNYTENSIRTYTGKVFDLKILDPDSICIEDIAHSLSQTVRFAGHLKHFYSVAQHSLLVSHAVSPENKLAALLHDASEAYLGDMPSPFKKMMPEYKKLEENVMRAIAEKFEFQYPLPKEVKLWDKKLLQLEWNWFVENNNPIVTQNSRMSEFRFLNRFKRIKKK